MFKKAVPVWAIQPNEKEKYNTHLIFKAETESLEESTLSVAAIDFYKLYVNGKFIGFGPARASKGYARVDKYNLSAYSKPDGNEILIEVAGYYCKSLSTAQQEAFFAAELEISGEVALYTGRDFKAYINCEIEKRSERYSVQRHFGEIYNITDTDRFEDKNLIKTQKVANEIKFIDRRVSYADFSVSSFQKYTSKGIFKENAKNGRTNAYSFKISNWGYFEDEEIKHKPFRYIDALTLEKTDNGAVLPASLSKEQWLMLDIGKIEVGFLQLSVEAQEDSEVILAWSEWCENGIFELGRMNAQTVVQYNIKKGIKLSAETFEPYGFKNIAVFVKSGNITVNSIGYRTYIKDMRGMIKRDIKDPELKKIYDGAVKTFAHNVVDLYMDCPTRERAGWLCDSYFTGRAEYFFFGNSEVEDAFLENYVLYKSEGEYLDGELPMVYPSDSQGNGKNIPQWSMWYVLEVCEYLTKRNKKIDKELFRPSIIGVLRFLKRHENELGLIENLSGMNFIEWSKANQWGHDVNYPTNMLYAEILEVSEEVFGVEGLKEKAKKLRETVIDMSFNGKVFIDNAVRNSQGKLENTLNVSEAGQYYAVLFGKLDLESEKFSGLKNAIIDGFKDFVKQNEAATTPYDFCPINAFIGMYLRMNVLYDMGDPQLMSSNLKHFFGGMCDKTGTLWELKNTVGSLDHGFASYAAVTIPLADS